MDQTTAQFHLDLDLKLIVVIIHLLEMKIFATQQIIVGKMQEIVILIMSVKAIYYVDQTTVQPHLDFTLELIVVIILLSEMKISVQFQHLVEKMKEIVILRMNVKQALVVQAVHPILDLV